MRERRRSREKREASKEEWRERGKEERKREGGQNEHQVSVLDSATIGVHVMTHTIVVQNMNMECVTGDLDCRVAGVESPSEVRPFHVIDGVVNNGNSEAGAPHLWNGHHSRRIHIMNTSCVH